MKLYVDGFFKFYLTQPGPWLEIDLASPKPLDEVLEQLGIPASEVHLTVVNRELVELGQVMVTNEDEVRIYPPIGGGQQEQL